MAPLFLHRCSILIIRVAYKQILNGLRFTLRVTRCLKVECVHHFMNGMVLNGLFIIQRALILSDTCPSHVKQGSTQAFIY
jgi:hypothetical protein